MINFDDFGWKHSRTCAHVYLLPAIANIFKKLKLGYSLKILDAGCGGGYIMHKLYESGYKEISGFDFSESGIERARNNYKELSEKIIMHDAYESSLPDNFCKIYDVILSIEVIEHMYSPFKYLSNLNLWLKKGGILIISAPYHGYLKNLATALLNRIDFHFGSLNNMGHIKFFSKATISELLEKSGFRVVEFFGCGRVPYLWKSMLLVAENI